MHKWERFRHTRQRYAKRGGEICSLSKFEWTSYLTTHRLAIILLHLLGSSSCSRTKIRKARVGYELQNTGMDRFWFFLVQTILGERNELIYQKTDRLKIALSAIPCRFINAFALTIYKLQNWEIDNCINNSYHLRSWPRQRVHQRSRDHSRLRNDP